ncbi:MAG TPA: CAP domain-containing protein [Chloroflexota bacterium]|nr:CAP domain-containing protein [Chloroflexota bacterium]
MVEETRVKMVKTGWLSGSIAGCTNLGAGRGGRRARTLLGIIMIATLSLPLATGRATASRARDVLVLTGQVCARQTGQPIANALVGVDNTWTRGGSDGTFRVTTKPGVRVFLRAAAPGYQASDLVTVSAAGGGRLTGTAGFSFCGNLALPNAFVSADNAVKIVPVNQAQPASPHNVTLIGSATEALEADAAIQLPNGRVVLSLLKQQGAVFVCKTPIHYGPGRYLVEINAQAGYALVKLPLFAGVPYQPPAAPPSYVADTAALTIDQVRALAYKDINHQRALAGLPPLSENGRLMRETQAHSDDVTAGGFVGIHAHIGSNGSTPLQRVEAAGVPFHELAEVVGQGETMGEIIFGLMESPAHRWAIMGNFSELGVGVARQGANYVLTVDFVHP